MNHNQIATRTRRKKPTQTHSERV
uniref:Uncharacterized protein n=1 Tax=Arundo donax TaxID=35708 RepID=A0A0A9F1D6_ARUDO